MSGLRSRAYQSADRSANLQSAYRSAKPPEPLQSARADTGVPEPLGARPWCSGPFTPRATGGRPQRFHSERCRRASEKAMREWG
jgi:hypothetical protein